MSDPSDSSFRPTAPLENLRRRAELLEIVRRFFADRGVLEVETPLLGDGVIVERHLDPIRCEYGDASPGRLLWLQTSPEAAMKRLVASGSGPIYQISRAFRDGERGALHNPEFTIVEWYRPGLDHLALMDEVADLVRTTLGTRSFEKRTYREVFEAELGLDPHRASAGDLATVAAARGLRPPESLERDRGDRDAWLDFLLSTCVQPRLGVEAPVFLDDYPASQAALATTREEGGAHVAERFELFVRGVELCNGYRELLDPGEHERRFDAANRQRRADGKSELPVDRRFLEALEAGLPPCSGVALGFDRLVMLACGASSIDEVLSFPFE